MLNECYTRTQTHKEIAILAYMCKTKQRRPCNLSSLEQSLSGSKSYPVTFSTVFFCYNVPGGYMSYKCHLVINRREGESGCRVAVEYIVK